MRAKHFVKPVSRRRVSALLALSALGSACGGGASGPEPTSPEPPAPQPPPPQQPPPEPPPPAGSLLTTLVKFAETAARNWNFEGHQVPTPFDEGQGWWDYTDTTFTPWLFDRAEAWHLLARMTGSARWRAQADSDLAYYESRLNAAGFFMNKTGEDDTKYSYVHTWGASAAKRTAAFDATVAGFPDVFNPSSPVLWTERELWVALDAASKYHAVTGSAAALARGQAMLDQWDAACAGRKAPLVSYTRHEGGGPGGSQPPDLVTSPWMAALYFQAARLYIARALAATAQVQRQASDYFDWLNTPGNRGFYPGTDAHPQYAGLIFPAYLAGGTLIGDAGPDAGNMDHALAVAGFIAFAVQAKAALGVPTAAATQRLADMKATAASSFAGWTRTTLQLPKYRIRQPRAFNWWTRGLHELWVLGAA
jgi:hypothetical protein